MNEKKIEFYIKTVYGNENRYIKEPFYADAVARLTGKKTVSESDMEALGELGFTFEEVLPPRL